VNGEGDKPPITDYRDLDVWKEAMELAAVAYEATRAFPREEVFGMTSQMRRASVSIAANIAEGFGRAQTRPFIQFLRVAQGSLKELETLVALAERVSLLEASTQSADGRSLQSPRQDAGCANSRAGSQGSRSMIPTIHHSPFTIHAPGGAGA
jgi:four helix bundle protein